MFHILFSYMISAMVCAGFSAMFLKLASKIESTEIMLYAPKKNLAIPSAEPTEPRFKTEATTINPHETKESSIAFHSYVTINGKEPKEPVSPLHSRKFIIFGLAFAIIVGLLAYFCIFAH